MKKSDYLQTLKDLKDVLPSDATTTVDATPVAPVETQTELPLPVVEAKSTVGMQNAPVATPDASQITQVAAAAPVEAELFPGFNALPEDRRKEIADRFKLAGEAETAKQELARKTAEFNQLHGRLQPTQQQLSKQQLEVARLQQEVNKFKDATAKTANSALRQKIDAMKEQFPADAEMWESTLNEIESAKQGYGDIGEKLQRLEQREYLNEQKQALSSVHPDWQKMTAKVQQDDGGNYRVQRTVDTPEAQEFELWANALDPYERNTIWPLFKSTNATDAIYVLNRFKQDKATALILAGQAPQQDTQAAPPAAQTAAPAPDPDPSRRTTAQPPAQSQRAAGQPKSDKQRELIAAAELLRKQGKLPPLSQQRRA